jgi:hypothetical protein
MRPDSAERSVITREEGIRRAAEILSRAWSELAETYALKGRAGIAAIEREPGADGEACAALYESWYRAEIQRRDAARRQD